MELKCRWMLVLCSCFASTAFAQTNAMLPHIAEGTYAGGSLRTTFVLVNGTDLPAVANILLTGDTGSPLQVTIPEIGTASQFVVTIQAGGTRLLQTAGSGTLRTGAARVTSAQTVGVSAIFSVFDTAGRFISEAGVDNSPPGTEFVIPVDTTGNFNTGVAFFDSGASASNLSISLLNGAGEEVQRAADSLQPGEHKARFFAGQGQIFPTATNFRGTAVVTSSAPISAVVLRQNSQPLSFTSLPAIPRTGGKAMIILSQVANGTFSLGSMTTTFPIFNPSTVTANVVLTLTGDDGSPFTASIIGMGSGSTFNLSLPPGGSAFLQTDGKGAITAGSAVITSDAPVGASAIFSLFDPQGGFLTETGVGDAALQTNLTLPVDINPAADTGFAFYNPNPATVTLAMRLLDAAGATHGSAQVKLPPGGHDAQFASQLFAGQGSFQGSIAISSDSGAVAAITLRQHSSPLTFTTLPEVEGDAQVGTPVLSLAYYLPYINDGGGARTSVILTNPGAKPAAATLSWHKADGSQRPMSLGSAGTKDTFNLVLAPGMTQILRSDGSGDGRPGTASVTSDQPLGVEGVLSSFDSAGRLLGDSSVEAAATSSGFRIELDSAGNVVTGFAAYNPGATDAAITVTVSDAAGNSQASTNFVLPAGTGATRSIAGDLFAGISNSNLSGIADIQSTVPVAIQVVRQAGSSPAIALLPATAAVAGRLLFFVPQIENGPIGAGTLRSTILLSNLSASNAVIAVDLSKEDGSPWTVSVAGMGANSHFSLNLTPGASAVLHTDGSGAFGGGTARIRSSVGISAGAVVSAFDGQGNLVSESAAGIAPLMQRMVIPIDGTASSGAVLWNAGSKPVTLSLSLLDPSGNATMAVNAGPVAPGARLTGSITDYFPGAITGTGAILVRVAGPITGFVSATGTRQVQGAPVPTTLASVRQTLPSIPHNVIPVLDANFQANADVGPAGGSLVLVDAAGNRFTLTIPAGALFSTETIGMTSATALGDVAVQRFAGVQLSPDGLALMRPATLVIEPVSPISPDTLAPLGWNGIGQAVYLNLTQPNANKLTMILSHFSGAGAGSMTGGDLTAELLRIIDMQAFDESVAEEALLSGSADLMDLLQMAYDDWLGPLWKAALDSRDTDVIQCAISRSLGILRQLELLGAADTSDIAAQLGDDIEKGRVIYTTSLKDRCNKHDFTVFYDIVAQMRQEALLSMPSSFDDLNSILETCPPVLYFDFKSRLTATVVGSPGGTYSGQISANVLVNGHFTKDILTTVSDPSKDLLTSYLMNGADQETYDFASYRPSQCSISVASLLPATMKVLEGQAPQQSQVQFKFSAHYDPAPYSISGTQLCSFCPVRQKKPIKVELLIDPGIPAENTVITCSGQSTNLQGQGWFGAWGILHGTPGVGDMNFLTGWTLHDNGNPYASKNIGQTLVSNSSTAIEDTKMKLSYKR